MSFAGRMADRVLSALVPKVQAAAVECRYVGSNCERCAPTKARLFDYFVCSDGSQRRIDWGCDSC